MATKVPPSLKSIAHYIKIANDNATRDPVVYYWCLYYAVQTGMKVDRSSSDALQFLTGLLSTLETVKKQLSTNDAITNEVVAQAHLEAFAFKLFTYADGREKNGDVDNAVVQSFLTSGHVLDVLSLFGTLEENIASTKKYAKWKATQIFTCLKNGTPYTPSHPQEDESSMDAFPQPQHSSNPFDAPAVPRDDDIFNRPAIPPRTTVPTVPPPSEHNYGFPIAPIAPPLHTVSSSNSFNANLTPHHSTPEPSSSVSSYTPGTISMQDLNECKKLCKWAMSAIDYEDVPSVIDNLKKALAIVERR